LPEELDRPESVDALYIDRGAPAEPWRPVLTGDVFTDVQVPGVEPHELTMIISHPCTMRVGEGRLREKLQALPIRNHQDLRLEQWVDGYRKVFPLPELWPAESVAARLDEFGMVSSEEFQLERRIACLSEAGIALLLQRFFCCMSRVVVGLDAINKELLGPMSEAELLEEWCEKLVPRRVDAGESLEEAIAAESREFDSLVTHTAFGASTLQKGLMDSVSAVAVRRIVRDQIATREQA
jgi:hypothetical protein